MTPFERLRQVAELLPAGTSVTVTREALLEALAGPGAPAQPSAEPPGDLTVAELAERFRRSASTVRGWCERGRFEGAYKLNGRDWRVPPAAIETFRERERGPHRPGGADLGAWRTHRRPA